MRFSIHDAWALVLLVAASASAVADEKPAEALAAIKNDQEAARAEVVSGQKGATSDAERKIALERYHKRIGELGRRALALAEKHAEAPQAIDALLWAPCRIQNEDK